MDVGRGHTIRMAVPRGVFLLLRRLWTLIVINVIIVIDVMNVQYNISLHEGNRYKV